MFRQISLSSSLLRFGNFRHFTLGQSLPKPSKNLRGQPYRQGKSIQSHFKNSLQPFQKSTTISVNPTTSFTKTFIRCGLFSFVSINAVFAGCIVWNYENWRARLRRYRRSGLRESLRELFISVFGRPPRQPDIFWAIASVNFLVYVLLNTRRFGSVCLRYFANTPFGPAPCRSLVLSIFSHQMFFHLFLNMYVLHNFTAPLVQVLGKEQYLALFLGGGIFASLVSSLAKAARGSRIPSVGASGAICAVLGAFCALEPQARLCVPLLVSVVPHSFTAETACWFIVAFEAIGATILTARSPIDHAAHLGGLLFGLYYGTEGRKIVMRHRDQVVTAWRQLKGRETDPRK